MKVSFSVSRSVCSGRINLGAHSGSRTQKFEYSSALHRGQRRFDEQSVRSQELYRVDVKVAACEPLHPVALNFDRQTY